MKYMNTVVKYLLFHIYRADEFGVSSANSIFSLFYLCYALFIRRFD